MFISPGLSEAGVAPIFPFGSWERLPATLSTHTFIVIIDDDDDDDEYDDDREEEG